MSSNTGPEPSWPTHPLRSVVAKLFVGLPVSRYKAKPGEDSMQEPVLSVGDIDNGLLLPRARLTPVALRAGTLERFRVQVDDLLVSCRGSLLKVARVHQDAASLLASSNFIVVRPSDAIHPAVLQALFRSQEWQETLRLRSRSSSGLMQLTARDLEDLSVPVPPSNVQADLVELLEAEEAYHQSALHAANLRRTLVSRLVTEMLSPPTR